MPTETDAAPTTASRTPPRRRTALTPAVLGGTGLVLLALFAATEATVAPDGTLTEPFAALALGTLALTATGLLALAWLFRGVRRRGACGRGSC